MKSCSSNKSGECKIASKSSSNSTNIDMNRSPSFLNLLRGLPLCWSSSDGPSTMGLPIDSRMCLDEEPFASPGSACPQREVLVSRSFDGSDFEDIRSDNHPCESRPFFMSEGSELNSPLLRQASQMSSEATTPKRRVPKQDRSFKATTHIDDMAEGTDPVGMTISELCLRASRRGRSSSASTTGTASYGFLFQSVGSSALHDGAIHEDDSDDEAN
eukprot:CAMPEP_0206503114 /NCGR_PEP_ID=MMETSP0324_2-20121206/54475_1 /ASSEMBLY_ACC=CAM_ASM_000836 /TAXON_ID=2866 /ORGANISM="Crypthecodinium cohnii, Strain Seligo" /LENGTH=214 /DNA_ID=CAMNT_0053991587 /DNA_START=65 /DNA_END=709 /DNA_ORIENTATION=+